ncbi:hypothetical protein BS47DRAFT_1401637 [Hydnum rufescens UP504]|uniref:Uncharacterized protein n=1 Tax=Hydnum rufescens UP504 TaxID=1448309 RepID=A0A9P6DN40_9AGAM|nr:hypothetical protein BS47DRAFT_1401637 [Hydnum rufescens UP504]
MAPLHSFVLMQCATYSSLQSIQNVELDLDSELPYISTCQPRFRQSTSICRMSQFTALNPHDDFRAPPFVHGTFRGYICLVGVSNSTPSMARTNEVTVEAALPKG